MSLIQVLMLFFWRENCKTSDFLIGTFNPTNTRGKEIYKIKFTKQKNGNKIRILWVKMSGLKLEIEKEEKNVEIVTFKIWIKEKQTEKQRVKYCLYFLVNFNKVD